MELQRLETYIHSRKEDLKVDLKWQLCLEEKEQHIEFAIDVASIANSKSTENPESKGYLIIGVPDAREDKTPPRQSDCAPFGDTDQRYAFNQKIQQHVDEYCDPPVDVSYKEVQITERLIGLVTIFIPPVLPIFIHNTGRNDLEWTVWVRGGAGHPGKRHAKGSEIRGFFLDYLRTLNPYMSDEEWESYEGHIANLLRSSEADRIAVLATEMVQSDADRRARACQALGEITGLEEDTEKLAVQLLIGALYDDERSVQWEAVRSLNQLGDKRAVSSLSAVYPEDDPELATEIIGTLQTIGELTAVQTLRDLYSEDDSDLAEEIIDAVQVIGSPAAAHVLQEIHKETEDAELLEYADVALAELGI